MKSSSKNYKNHTFRFHPDKYQILRDRCCISGHCNLIEDYRISYTFHYDINWIDLSLMRNGGTIFSKSISAFSKEKPYLTLHEAERIVTDAVVEYVESRKNKDLTSYIFSGLRPWNDDDPPLAAYENVYAFVEYGTERLIQVNRFHDGCPSSYDAGEKPDILDGKFTVIGTIRVTHKKTRCQIVYVKHESVNTTD